MLSPSFSKSCSIVSTFKFALAKKKKKALSRTTQSNQNLMFILMTLMMGRTSILMHGVVWDNYPLP
jgi:hypothetical protein